MTYLAFLLWFIVPMIIFLMIFNNLIRRMTRTEWGAIFTLMALAFTYATPWDNLLVALEIWTYAPGAVIAVIGYVPIEEYTFFLLQPLMTGLWTVMVMNQHKPKWESSHNTARWWGVGISLGITAIGFMMLIAGDQWLYLGLILSWAAPVSALHWGVGGQYLWRNRHLLLTAILPPSIYLALVDRYAIVTGIWEIMPATSTGILIADLPIEEGLFFFITNILVVQGVVLYVWVFETGTAKRWLQIIHRKPVLSEVQTG